MNARATAQALRSKFADAVSEPVEFRGETTVIIATEHLLDACTFARDECGYDFLSDLTAVDWLDRDPRFDVVYHLTSMQDWSRIRFKVQVNDGEPVESVVPIWPAANWPEREAWDLFGIEFRGHPDLRRIMLPDGWVGFPLRKDSIQS